MELVTKGARTRTMKLRQSQDDRASGAIVASAAAVPERRGFCKLCPAFVASRFKLSIENHRLTRGSRACAARRSLGSFRAADFCGRSNIVPRYRSDIARL